jgi:tetratricopeptide (TPR) repeat protein
VRLNPRPRDRSPVRPAAILDESKVQALRTVADKDSTNAVARAQLGNLYYDAGRYTDAIKWYADSLAINPKDVDVSTDLGVSYYYNNQPDLALKQLEHSLQLDRSTRNRCSTWASCGPSASRI